MSAQSAAGTTLWPATGSNSVNGQLYSVDPTTAALTFIGNVTLAGNAISLTGLAVHPTTRVLYGVTGANSSNNPKSLVTINKATGAATLIGGLGGASAITPSSCIIQLLPTRRRARQCS